MPQQNVYILSQTYDKLPLNNFIFGFGITQFRCDTESKLEQEPLTFLICKKFIRRSGAILFAILPFVEILFLRAMEY